MSWRVGLIGWPVAHSVSPAMHQAAFQALDLDWRYDLRPVRPAELGGRLVELLAEGYRGLNVTVPHKQSVLALPDIEVDRGAAAIGAANTLGKEADGPLWATNTDWRGFADDLQAHGVDVTGADCLVLGSGGGARAVVYALRQLQAGSIRVVSRDPAGRSGVVGYERVPALAPRTDLVVNCTPLGMWPDVDHSPWPEGVPLPPDAVVYDLVYNPQQTRLMYQAEAAGLRAIGGLGMLVRQGAISLEQWSGQRPPLAPMFAAARAALDRMQDHG